MKLISMLTAAAVSVIVAAPAFATGHGHGTKVTITSPTCTGNCTVGGGNATAAATGQWGTDTNKPAIAASGQYITGTSTITPSAGDPNSSSTVISVGLGVGATDVSSSSTAWSATNATGHHHD